MYFFFFYCYSYHPVLPSFPTRRSSDLVPPFIPSSEDSDNIYGRGSCDAKGIVAAQIAACERLRKEGAAIWAATIPLASQERSEEHTSELQSLTNLVCRLLLENKK